MNKNVKKVRKAVIPAAGSLLRYSCFGQTAYSARNRYAQALQAGSAVFRAGSFGGRAVHLVREEEYVYC